MADETSVRAGFGDGERKEGDPIPAATVVLVREATAGSRR